ncbi:unnamed protein product [Nippostrongylus brasiliensis]|uniref:Transmembrane protein n=1 Tax=Nippostrongylus brasiliensis TaxID=27835 RepID=A0A0N4XCF8_NIPBR|nr:unnamed protein product [Nippostrongylus brasiliensis]
MSNPVFLVSIAERRNRNEMDFHNMPAMHDPNVRLSAFNVVSACAIALLLTALVVILVVAYIRAKSRTAFKWIPPKVTVMEQFKVLGTLSMFQQSLPSNPTKVVRETLTACRSSVIVAPHALLGSSFIFITGAE